MQQNPNTFSHLVVDVPSQTLSLMQGDQVEETFSISTSKFGLGSEAGSFRTPLGRFTIAEKIGHHEPLGTCFSARKPVDPPPEPNENEDLILSRILWLDGCEPENANTHDRYIYIHGTNQESLIGTPASHGCIRMKNADIVRLFEKVEVGTAMEILA